MNVFPFFECLENAAFFNGKERSIGVFSVNLPVHVLAEQLVRMPVSQDI